MAVEEKIIEIETDILDVINTKFTYSNTKSVPNSENSNLTFERGVEKKGKIIETCVLFVDIRDSVKLNVKHQTQTMGRVYTAFTKAIIKIANHHNGFVRNIIGDRIMIVFPSENCFSNSVDCAISINHISKNVINKCFKDVDFKCGIGVDFGELKVVKVGLEKRGSERSENKNLVWIGYPANIASRLTDFANKVIEEEIYIVTRNPINPKSVKPLFSLSSIFGHSQYDPNAPYYLTSTETIEMTKDEFASDISSIKNGELYMRSGNFIKFSKENKKTVYSEILITDNVYNGLKRENPNRKSIKENYWKEINHTLKNVKSKIYGGSITWDI